MLVLDKSVLMLSRITFSVFLSSRLGTRMYGVVSCLGWALHHYTPRVRSDQAQLVHALVHSHLDHPTACAMSDG